MNKKMAIVLGLLVLFAFVLTIGFTSKPMGCSSGSESDVSGANQAMEQAEDSATDQIDLIQNDDYNVSIASTNYSNTGVNFKFDEALPITYTVRIAVTSDDGFSETAQDNVHEGETTGSVSFSLPYGVYTITGYLYEGEVAEEDSPTPYAQSSPFTATVDSSSETIQFVFNEISGDNPEISVSMIADVETEGEINQYPVITLATNDDGSYAINLSLITVDSNDYLKLSIDRGNLTVADPEEGNFCNQASRISTAVACITGAGVELDLANEDIEYFCSIAAHGDGDGDTSRRCDYCDLDIYIPYEVQYGSLAEYPYHRTTNLDNISSCTATVTATDTHEASSGVDITITIPRNIGDLFDSRHEADAGDGDGDHDGGHYGDGDGDDGGHYGDGDGDYGDGDGDHGEWRPGRGDGDGDAGRPHRPTYGDGDGDA
ncbi:MAG: hypothetical protein ABIA04_03645 [Pseudomonadota bacterium]